MFDGDTMRVALDAGGAETVRLIGVDTPETSHPERPVERFGHEAAVFTRSLADGRRVRLERDPLAANRDRYGRLLRYVRLPDGTLLNGEIVARGYGHALTAFPFSRLEEFRELERRAREAGRGLWAPDDEATGDALAPDEAAAHVGRHRTVCGRVASARYLADSRGRPTFLNLGRPYPDQPFTAVIWGADRSRFGEPEAAWLGREICVSGTVETHRGVPQIVLRSPGQLRAR